MNLQNYEKKNATIGEDFLTLKRFENRLNLSWSNRGFGIEPLAASAARIGRNAGAHLAVAGNLLCENLAARRIHPPAAARLPGAARLSASRQSAYPVRKIEQLQEWLARSLMTGGCHPE